MRQKRGEYEARLAALPDLFRQRIETFRARRGDEWRHKFESYEMYCLEQAALFARRASEVAPDGAVDWLQKFMEAPYEKQRDMVPEMDDEHSSNTFGFSVTMAVLYLNYLKEKEQHPDYVVNMHGSICPLVGCQEFGCYDSTLKKEELEAAEEKEPA